jgi:hemerythrin
MLSSVAAMNTTGPSSTAVRDRFLADHRELENLFARLLVAFEASDRAGIEALWNEFYDRISSHFDAEERFMIPRLFVAHPRDARAILAEHRHIRSRLSELGYRVDLHFVPLEITPGFVDELRAHIRHEDDVLYRWADDNLAPEEQSALLAALTAGGRDASQAT